MDRMFRIKALGYEIIYIWESDYKQYAYDSYFDFTNIMDYSVRL